MSQAQETTAIAIKDVLNILKMDAFSGAVVTGYLFIFGTVLLIFIVNYFSPFSRLALFLSSALAIVVAGAAYVAGRIIDDNSVELWLGFLPTIFAAAGVNFISTLALETSDEKMTRLRDENKKLKALLTEEKKTSEFLSKTVKNLNDDLKARE